MRRLHIFASATACLSLIAAILFAAPAQAGTAQRNTALQEQEDQRIRADTGRGVKPVAWDQGLSPGRSASPLHESAKKYDGVYVMDGSAPGTTTVQTQSVSNGLEIDSRSYANDYHVSRDEALKRLKLQSGLAAAIPKWSALAGSRLAGAYIRHDPLFGVVIRVTGRLPILELDKIASIASVPVEVQYGETHSQLDLIGIVEGNNWGALSDRIQGVYADVRKGAIHFDFYGSEAEAGELGTLLASYKALQSIPVKVVRWDAPGSDTNRGGRILSKCTSAFTIQNAYGTPGMLTAGHCDNPQSYWWFSGPGPFSMNFQDERRQSNSDIQWHTTSAQGIEPLFHADSTTSARAQIGVGVGSVGQYLCKRGTVSGYACTTVTSITYAPTYRDACLGTTCSAVFSLTSGASPSLGDSGGPWFIGNEPHGITKGRVGSQAVFTRVWYLNTMGVTLLQG